MSSEVVQVRMPKTLLKNIEKLVQSGLYKNRSEVIIDAMRHFIGADRRESDIAAFIRLGLIGKSNMKAKGLTKADLERLWKKVRTKDDWKDLFGENPEQVMARLRGRI